MKLKCEGSINIVKDYIYVALIIITMIGLLCSPVIFAYSNFVAKDEYKTNIAEIKRKIDVMFNLLVDSKCK